MSTNMHTYPHYGGDPHNNGGRNCTVRGSGREDRSWTVRRGYMRDGHYVMDVYHPSGETRTVTLDDVTDLW